MNAHGFFLRTRPGLASPHALAGPRDAHAFTFPACPGCAVATSPVFSLSFDDPDLAALGLWDGRLVLCVCHNGCFSEDSWVWDYVDAKAPALTARAESVGPPLDREFEQVPLVLVPRLAIREDVVETESRCGGEPAWLQTGFEERDGQVVAVPTVVSCPRCRAPLPMLAQWSESGMEHVPSCLGSGTGAEVMGNPFIHFWFGCRACRVVVSFGQLD